MKELFLNDFITHYGIISPDVVADEYVVQLEPFELGDSDVCPVVKDGEGQLRMHNVEGGINVFAYDRFVTSCKKPKSFQKDRKRCDVVVTTRANNLLVCLIEFTSAIGNTRNLYEPILKKNGAIQYPGGKMEKIGVQLTESLRTMLDVPAVASEMKRRVNRVCVAAYRIYPAIDPEIRMRYPDNTYKMVEARETGEYGAILSMPSMENLGFEYRRVAYPTTLRIV